MPTGEVFALAVCYVDNFWETQLFWSTDFRTVGATTLNRTLLMEHFKEQHTKIWYLLAKYLFGQCAIWTNFRNHYFFGRFLNSSCKPFAQGVMDLSLEHPKE